MKIKKDDICINNNERDKSVDKKDLTGWSETLLSSDLNEAKNDEFSQKAEVRLKQPREETNKAINEEKKEEDEDDEKADNLSFKTTESVNEKKNNLINYYQSDFDLNFNLNTKGDKEYETINPVKAEKYNWTEKIKEMKNVKWLPIISNNANPKIICCALLMIILIIFLIIFLIVISNLFNNSQTSPSTLQSKYLKSCDCLSSQTDQCSQ